MYVPGQWAKTCKGETENNQSVNNEVIGGEDAFLVGKSQDKWWGLDSETPCKQETEHAHSYEHTAFVMIDSPWHHLIGSSGRHRGF